MNGLVDLFVIVFAGLIHASLQLGTAALLLLYHASLGQHSKKKTRELTFNYLVGFGLFTALTVASVCFVVLVIFSGAMPLVAVVILIGILMAMAVAIWFLYYRKSRGTELWIPRSFAKFITTRAEKTDDNVESFSLGMLMACAEMPFAIMLIIVAANSVLSLPQATQILAIAVYVAMASLPIWLTRILMERGKTIVDVQKWRVKNKNFLRIMGGVMFLVLAIFLIGFKVVG